ncbi:MAG: TIGR02281 family clan AA aspartic protease [Pseudomonadota bacterium]
MRSEFVFAVLVVLIALVGVRMLETFGPAGARDSLAVTAASARVSDQNLDTYFSSAAREVRVRPGPHAQFFLVMDVNNSSANFLVDTGASYVVLRDSDARAAGVHTSAADFTYPMRTANGETHAALVMLSRMEVGALHVEDVKAFVLPDAQLDVNLLGMSFLSRLKSVETREGELVLRG